MFYKCNKYFQYINYYSCNIEDTVLYGVTTFRRGIIMGALQPYNSNKVHTIGRYVFNLLHITLRSFNEMSP